MPYDTDKRMQRKPNCHLWSTYGTDMDISCAKNKTTIFINVID